MRRSHAKTNVAKETIRLSHSRFLKNPPASPLAARRLLLFVPSPRSSHSVPFRSLGDLAYSRGDLSAAFKAYVRTRDYCQTGKHILDMCLAIVRVTLELRNYVRRPVPPRALRLAGWARPCRAALARRCSAAECQACSPGVADPSLSAMLQYAAHSSSSDTNRSACSVTCRTGGRSGVGPRLRPAAAAAAAAPRSNPQHNPPARRRALAARPPPAHPCWRSDTR